MKILGMLVKVDDAAPKDSVFLIPSAETLDELRKRGATEQEIAEHFGTITNLAHD